MEICSSHEYQTGFEYLGLINLRWLLLRAIKYGDKTGKEKYCRAIENIEKAERNYGNL